MITESSEKKETIKEILASIEKMREKAPAQHERFYTGGKDLMILVALGIGGIMAGSQSAANVIRSVTDMPQAQQSSNLREHIDFIKSALHDAKNTISMAGNQPASSAQDASSKHESKSKNNAAEISDGLRM